MSRRRSSSRAPVPAAAPAPAAAVDIALTPDDERRLLRALLALGTRFRDGRDTEKVLRAALRVALDFFGLEEGCVVVLPAGREEVNVAFSVPRDARWDRRRLAAFIRGDKEPVHDDEMFARLRRRDRMWGALAVRGADRDFHREARRALSAIGATATELAERMDQARIREVRTRIDRKIMEQIRPKDLFYQILHGLRSLTEYDHSASLLIAGDEEDVLEVVAEQIAWRKGGSRHVGREVPLGPSARELLQREVVYGFQRTGDTWQEWEDRPGTELAELLSYHDDAAAARESAMICAPLVTRDGVLGLVKMSALHAGSFGAYEVDLVSRFLPQVSVALQNARRAESLEMRMIAAERKHAMADLARGVSHDVNNALGAVLPLVQEMRAEADRGELDPAVAADDLREIHRSLQVCRRIFGGMLNFARGAARREGDVPLHQEVETTLAILRDGMARRDIEIVVDVPRDLPPVRGVQADVEQLLLNLLTNARDSMPHGGRLSVRARRDGDALEIVIEDTGRGIDPDDLSKVQEPFFTTKRSGTGLGLAICRSIVSEMRGGLEIESRPGEGTRARLTLPALRESTS